MTDKFADHSRALPNDLGMAGRIVARLLLGVAVLTLGACQRADTPGSQTSAAIDGAAPPLKTVASIKELMDSTVDPAADGVWEAVSVIVDDKGIHRHEPHDETEWHAVRQHAVSLIESMNLVMIEGRHAAPQGSRAGLGELTPHQIDATIAANRAEFNQFAVATREAGVEALGAIDRKDTAALTRIGGVLDERCESCHTTFWYPNAPRPAA